APHPRYAYPERIWPTTPGSLEKLARGKMNRGPSSPGRVLADVRRKLGITRQTVARMTGCTERTVAAWENGRPPSAAGLRGIQELERLYQGLTEVVRAEYLPR